MRCDPCIGHAVTDGRRCGSHGRGRLPDRVDPARQPGRCPAGESICATSATAIPASGTPVRRSVCRRRCRCSSATAPRDGRSAGRAVLADPGVWGLAYVGCGAAMVGHAFPVFAGFRGGRSILTFVGGAAVFAPVAASRSRSGSCVTFAIGPIVRRGRAGRLRRLPRRPARRRGSVPDRRHRGADDLHRAALRHGRHRRSATPGPGRTQR
jgi:hypothetical protein